MEARDGEGRTPLLDSVRAGMPAMLEILLAQGTQIRLCKSCTDARGITPLPLIEGIEIGTLPLLAQWTLAADKVLTF